MTKFTADYDDIVVAQRSRVPRVTTLALRGKSSLWHSRTPKPTRGPKPTKGPKGPKGRKRKRAPKPTEVPTEVPTIQSMSPTTSSPTTASPSRSPTTRSPTTPFPTAKRSHSPMTKPSDLECYTVTDWRGFGTYDK